MMSTELYADNVRLELGRRIGKGGEGEVYTLRGRDGFAAKLYTLTDLRSREEKVAAMVGAGLAEKAPLVAFPVSTIRTASGTFAGFMMRLVDAHRPLHDIYSPGSRKHNFPKADFRFLVRVAANIARATGSVHAAGCVIGDINHSSILVSQRATVALIDADSFQYASGTHVFRCLVGVPEYTPPELQGASLGTITRTPDHDAFALAVVIVQLLFMGRHPFIGTVRSGELPSLADSIRDYRFVYAENRNVGMDQPPGTPALSDYTPAIAKGFEKAFSREGRGSRPSAASWVAVLQELEKSLVQCESDKLHYYGSAAGECPWCEMEERLGTVLFLPAFPSADLLTSTFDPGATAFNIERISAQLRSIQIPTRSEVQPALAQVLLSPSKEALSLLPNRVLASPFLKWVVVIAAIGLVIAVPQAWLVWGGAAWFLTHKLGKLKVGDATALINRYVSANQKWEFALDGWRKASGLLDAEIIATSVQEAIASYKDLSGRHARELQAYKSDRRRKQLVAFLDNFESRNANLRGVGPAKQAALASYGIETAADVEHSKIVVVPGFGEATASTLKEWRNRLEARFVYQETMNEVDRQEISRITASANAKASSLRSSILTAAENLKRLSARISTYRSIQDPTLNKLHVEVQQAKCDLEILRIPLPSIPRVAVPVPSARSPVPAAGSSGTVPTTSSGAKTCPRCGSAMVRRVARRGRNAGGAFWGCSRFPRCKGTRSI